MYVRYSFPLVLGALLVASCNKDGPRNPDSITPIPVDSEQPVDVDGDGIAEEDGDCDDSDPDVYPGRVEDCNGVDDNCNDLIDEGFEDTDADGTADCMDSEECDGLDNDGEIGRASCRERV